MFKLYILCVLSLFVLFINKIQGAAIGNEETDMISKSESNTVLKEYYLGDYYKASFFEAYRFCAGHNMTLATANSKEESDQLTTFLKTHANAKEAYWAAGTDIGKEGSWIWISNNQKITYNNWRSGEPNNYKHSESQSENCMHIGYGGRDDEGWKWNDALCDLKLYFICEGVYSCNCIQTV